MTDEARYEPDALEQATFIVPLGVHMAGNGSVTFDVPDDELIEDIRTVIAAFVEFNPENKGKGFVFGDNVLDVGLQRIALTDITKEVLRQMGTPDGGNPPDLDTMLASAFARFPQFVSFQVLAAGSGDLVADPLHTDRVLADQVKANYGVNA